jgi:hypothetical protein
MKYSRVGSDFILKNEGTIEMVILCCNQTKENRYEYINLIFHTVNELRLLESPGVSNFPLSEIFIGKKDNLVVFDFSPINYFDYLEEDINSKFKILCERVTYKVIAPYIPTK